MKQVGELNKQYEKMKERVHKAIEYLDAPERTNAEIDKWLPKYIALFDEWKALERMIGLEKR